MKNRWMVFIVLVGLFISPPAYAFLPFPDGGQTSGESSGLKSVKDDLLQFTSGGHVLGFGHDSFYVAGLDRVLRVEFVEGGPMQPVAEGAGESPDGTPALDTVTYSGVWDGVDVVYRAAEGGILESFYYVDHAKTGPAVDGIRLRYNRPVSLDEQGNLITSFENGHMVESAPIAWQEVDGEKLFVDASFVLHGQQEIGFALGDHLLGVPVIIDPILSWNTFLGGSLNDSGRGIALDGSGNVYVTGHSNASWGSPRRGHQGSGDAFVAKLNGSTGELVWHTFLGGPLMDIGNGIAVDGSGNVYVTGYSDGSWGSPVHAYTSGGDAFAARLDSSGSLIWNTFLGGSLNDSGRGIALDGSGNVYVTGNSSSAWGSPIRTYFGQQEAFAVRLDRDTGAMDWHTFLGGSGNDYGSGIAVDGSGNVYVAGYSSTSWGSPKRIFSGGSADAFAAQIDGASGDIWWHTFLGGSGYDYGRGIAVDGSGNVYVAGYSDASWGSPKRNFSGGSDAFAAKVSTDGEMLWHTFLGGSGSDEGMAVAVDGGGNVYVTGFSSASWGNPKSIFSGEVDGFAARVNPITGALAWNAFVGGAEWDAVNGIAVRNNGNLYVTGDSDAAWGSPVRNHSESTDAFAARLVIRTLSVNANRTASVPISANPSGYGGTTDYAKGVANGTAITLTAPEANGGARFSSWSGCDATDQSARTCTVTLNADKTVTANYKEGQPGVLMLLLDDE